MTKENKERFGDMFNFFPIGIIDSRFDQDPYAPEDYIRGQSEEIGLVLERNELRRSGIDKDWPLLHY